MKKSKLINLYLDQMDLDIIIYTLFKYMQEDKDVTKKLLKQALGIKDE